MGVSGCGKTTVGKLLSEKTGIPFMDADAFHPESNIQKMSNGMPLTDADRKPWLENLNHELIKCAEDQGAILACSALKESYREILSKETPTIHWVFLEGNLNLIKERIEHRKGHFMNTGLLQSQFDTLEIPSYSINVSVYNTPATIVSYILTKTKTQ